MGTQFLFFFLLPYSMQKPFIAGSLKIGQIEAVLLSNLTQFSVPGSQINPEKNMAKFSRVPELTLSSSDNMTVNDVFLSP